MTAPSGSNCCKPVRDRRSLVCAHRSRVGNGISANLEDTSNLPIKTEVKDLVKKSGWTSEEYEHLWRRDGGGSAALTSHGILSMSRHLPCAHVPSLTW